MAGVLQQWLESNNPRGFVESRPDECTCGKNQPLLCRRTPGWPPRKNHKGLRRHKTAHYRHGREEKCPVTFPSGNDCSIAPLTLSLNLVYLCLLRSFPLSGGILSNCMDSGKGLKNFSLHLAGAVSLEKLWKLNN